MSEGFGNTVHIETVLLPMFRRGRPIEKFVPATLSIKAGDVVQWHSEGQSFGKAEVLRTNFASRGQRYCIFQKMN